VPLSQVAESDLLADRESRVKTSTGVVNWAATGQRSEIRRQRPAKTNHSARFRTDLWSLTS